MNVFADLIEELKEENLLEETIIELKRKAAEANGIIPNGSNGTVKPDADTLQANESGSGPSAEQKPE
ncbi:hypothetical protein WAJ72_22660, partial [Acinetobacter baumannii]